MIGKRLISLRKTCNLTRPALGKILGVSMETIKSYEEDKIEPSVKMLEKIADYFGVSTDFLLGREEISGDEEMIIGLMAGLSPEEKKKVIEMVKVSIKFIK